jgi:CRP/FNR family transcriptional regulator, transcriptional activator FtrB
MALSRHCHRRKTERTASYERSELRAVPGFASLPAKMLERLVHEMPVERFQQKTVLVHEGQTQECLFLVFEGLMQQFTTFDGREVTLSVLKSPTLVYPHAMQRGTVALASLRTLDASRIGRIPVSHARRLAAEAPEFSKAMSVQVVNELQRLFHEYKCARTRNALERLAAWVIAMHERAEQQNIELPYDKWVLAARLGVEPATLSRDFARLAEYGVEVSGKTLRIRDLPLLRTLTGPDGASRPLVP